MKSDRYDSGLSKMFVLMVCNKDLNFEDYTKGVGSWNRGPGRAVRYQWYFSQVRPSLGQGMA